MNTKKNTFIEKLESAIQGKELIKLSLTARKNNLSDLKKIIVTAVELKKGYYLNFVYRHTTKDITKNFELVEAVNIISEAIDNEFNNAELSTVNGCLMLYTLANEKIQLKSTSTIVKETITFTHDNIKNKLIDLNNNIYLRELGITNAHFELRREMSDKYRQINKYIELLAPNISDLSLPDNFQVVDMGSGKGYLTFALYDYLKNNLKLSATLTGIEFREDLINICNTIAEKAGFNQLTFKKGTIAETKIDKIDI